jgi:hypothetical protein
MINDTHKNAARVQIELLKKVGATGRAKRMLSLSHSVMLLSKRAVERRFKSLNSTEQSLMFIKINYGDDLQQKVRSHLEKIGKL